MRLIIILMFITNIMYSQSQEVISFNNRLNPVNDSTILSTNDIVLVIPDNQGCVIVLNNIKHFATEQMYEIVENSMGLIVPVELTNGDSIAIGIRNIDHVRKTTYGGLVKMDYSSGKNVYEFITDYSDFMNMTSPPIDGDTDSSNELIKSFELVDNEVVIEDNGGQYTMDLLPYLDNTDKQELSILDNEISITGGNSIMLPTEVDGIVGNEYISNFSLSNDIILLDDGGGSYEVGLSRYLDNTDEQELSIINNEIFISDGNSIMLPTEVDGVIGNEYVTGFSLSNNTLSITDGGGSFDISLSSYLDNTDNQQLSIIGNEISISNGNIIVLPDEVDGIIGNEYVGGFSLFNNLLSLNDGGGSFDVDLSSYLDNTDEQQLSIIGNEISISNGNTIEIPMDNDNVTGNEYINSFGILSNTLSVSDGGGLFDVDLSPYLDNTDNQELSISNNQISISNGNTISIPAEVDGVIGNEYITGVSLLNNTLSVTDGGGSYGVGLASYLDNTDEQQLSIIGNEISISNGNTIQIPLANLTDECNTDFSIIGNDISITDQCGVLSLSLPKDTFHTTYSGRQYIDLNTWRSFRNNYGGPSDIQFSQSMGTGTDPTMNQSRNGIPVPFNSKVTSLYINGRHNNAEVMIVEVDVTCFSSVDNSNATTVKWRKKFRYTSNNTFTRIFEFDINESSAKGDEIMVSFRKIAGSGTRRYLYMNGMVFFEK